MDQQPEEKKDSNEIDLKKILLPTKEVHTPGVAERVNAGVLLEQEQKAELPKPEPAPAPKVEPKEDDSSVKSLETYQGDIESMVEKKNVSVVSIAAAEADKKREPEPATKPSRGIFGTSLYIGGGLVLVLIVAGAWFYIAAREAPVGTTAPVNAQAPFITVDASEAVPVSTATRIGLMNTLVNAKNSVSVSLGLIEQLVPTVESTDAQGNTMQTELDIQTLLTTLAPTIPQELTRTLGPTYLLGVHNYAENDAFIIMQTDSYETAYAGMLAWETTMQSDLSPLFDRTPPVSQSAGPAITTATSTGAQASTTPQTTQVLDTGFSDQVVDNRDARVITDASGNILLLWTFLDRSTLVITNNAETLREIITRVTTPATSDITQ